MSPQHPHAEANRALEQALAQCAAGDRAAFATVYELTAPKFTAIVMGMVKCEETTRDILQRAYVSIWNGAASYDPGRANAFTWMLVITRNRAIDVLRSRKRAAETDVLDEDLVDEAIGPDAITHISQLRRLLDEHLTQLPEQMAAAIRLRFLQGYSCQEIGERMNVPPNTVKSWIRRGLERLKAQIPFASFSQAF